MTSEFSLPLRVYIEDTDAGGIVYYVNYLKFFERARTEFMRSMGQPKAAVSDDGAMYVVTEAAIRYRKPARLDDELAVTAAVTAVSGAQMTFVQAVRRNGETLAEGEVKVACVDQQSGRPRRLDRVVREALQDVVRQSSQRKIM